MSSLVDQLEVSLKPIERFLNNENVNEIIISPGGVVQKIDNKSTFKKNVFTSPESVLTLARLIARFSKRTLDWSNPIVDGYLPSGKRVCIVGEPVGDELTIYIRNRPLRFFSFNELLKLGAIDEWGILLIEYYLSLKKNIVVFGGVSSGKSTVLSAILDRLDDSLHIRICEDSRELQCFKPFTRFMRSKPAHFQGDFEITLQHIVKATLRTAPDIVVIGECRDAEVVELLKALNSGHPGMTTIHANDPQNALRKLEQLYLISQPRALSLVRQWISENIHVLVQCKMGPDGKRRIISIDEVNNQGGEYRIENRYYFDGAKFCFSDDVRQMV